MLDAVGELQEHLAGVEDYELAEATWQAAIARWPKAVIILRQGARVVRDSRQPRIVKETPLRSPLTACLLMTQSGHRPDRNPAAPQSPATEVCYPFGRECRRRQQRFALIHDLRLPMKVIE